MAESPYLTNENRLADVIAAIQVMGSYKFYKLDFLGWADRIAGTKDAKKWETVFKEHPEFFRLDVGRTKASLVWRRTFQKDLNVDTKERITKEKLISLSPEETKRISRSVLGNDEIIMLINSAINLHSRALSDKQDKRWWVPVLITIIGFAVGLIPYILEKIL